MSVCPSDRQQRRAASVGWSGSNERTKRGSLTRFALDWKSTTFCYYFDCCHSPIFRQRSTSPAWRSITLLATPPAQLHYHYHHHHRIHCKQTISYSDCLVYLYYHSSSSQPSQPSSEQPNNSPRSQLEKYQISFAFSEPPN